MLSQKNREWVAAARSLGARPLRIIYRHVAPNALPPLLTHIALVMSFAVLIEASLAFLGLGQQPPEPSLGGLINASKTHLRAAWWYAFFPGAVLAILLVCLNFLADAVNEATSPYAQFVSGKRRAMSEKASTPRRFFRLLAGSSSEKGA
jgi:peptide/nickel transport system permease protein